MAKKKRKTRKSSQCDVYPLLEPAANVVVYRNPGPDECDIAEHARKIVEANAPWGSGGGLGYLTLVESDFDRLWDGVDRGDTYGTAFSVLRFLGPLFQQFVGRTDDFLFGWIGGEDRKYGKVLLLQIVPRPHLVAELN
ncbi:MAG TPA: hypothetical protein PLW35_05575 [Verrucomicrobiota bacterium]|nr:hypothetical protein [Verrucomicrobiota bacterium]HOK77177.1 hypothetical protein [Verrucomicrobiota bacterium]